jgi:hypothetical protein
MENLATPNSSHLLQNSVSTFFWFKGEKNFELTPDWLRSETKKPGLPDFSWYMPPKPEKVPNVNKILTGHKISQMSVKYSILP